MTSGTCDRGQRSLTAWGGRKALLCLPTLSHHGKPKLVLPPRCGPGYTSRGCKCLPPPGVGREAPPLPGARTDSGFPAPGRGRASLFPPGGAEAAWAAANPLSIPCLLAACTWRGVARATAELPSGKPARLAKMRCLPQGRSNCLG